MITIYQLKPAFQRLLSPLVQQLAKGGITPNQVTLMALGLSLLTGVGLLIYPHSTVILWVFPFFLLIRMGLNAIDGMLAREYALESDLGLILNELGDAIADSVLYLPFALIVPEWGIFIVPIVILSLIGEMAGILGLIIAEERRYDGPMGKSDRAFFFSLVAFYLAGNFPLYSWLDSVWIGVMVLLVWTLLNRVKNALSSANNLE